MGRPTIKAIKAKQAVPNIFTFGNLVFGILSLLATFNEDYKLSCIFILLAGLMDRYDGRVARFLNVSSELGKELDSLADLVSFGIAPSFLIFQLNDFINLGLLGYFLILIFPIAGAYRLARYNCSTFNNIYSGIPITLAGMLVAFYSFISLSYGKPNNAFSIPFVLILSYLMISKIQVRKR